MSIHAANPERSARLQKTLAALQKYGMATTWEISKCTDSMAVHTDVAELRKAGYIITCDYSHSLPNRRRVYVYMLLGHPIKDPIKIGHVSLDTRDK